MKQIKLQPDVWFTYLLNDGMCFVLPVEKVARSVPPRNGLNQHLDACVLRPFSRPGQVLDISPPAPLAINAWQNQAGHRMNPAAFQHPCVAQRPLKAFTEFRL